MKLVKLMVLFWCILFSLTIAYDIKTFKLEKDTDLTGQLIIMILVSASWSIYFIYIKDNKLTE